VQRPPTPVERFLAEALGTFLLVFVGCGTVALVNMQHASGRPFTLGDFLLFSLAFGFVLFIVVLIVGRVSGAHVNPAVTLALWANGRLDPADVASYLGGQIVGALAGAAAILIVYGKNASTLGHLGAPSLASGTSLVQGLAIEALGAFILMLAIMATAVDGRAPAGWAGLAIGMALAVVNMFMGAATGASVNPARALGPDVINFFYKVSTDVGQYVAVYLIGPIIGAIAAAFLYAYITHLPRPTASRTARPAARRGA